MESPGQLTNHKGRLWLLAGGGLLVIILLIYQLRPILSPFVVGALLAYLGDPLVEADGTRVELAQTFRPGVSNGLYKGAVRLHGPGQPAEGSLHALNAVCSLEDTPGWPPYDNLYGYPIEKVAEARELSGKSRWQILYHFDGRIEGSGDLEPQAWTARLRDNLCRRGDFDDSTARQ